MSPLDDVVFDHSSFTLLADAPDVRRWSTASGDTLALHHCPAPPRLPGSLDRLRAHYRALVEPIAGLVEVETPVVDRDVVAVRAILKAAQQPTGRIYTAALTVPFRDFSYVLELRCEERGWTGVREATIFDRLLKAREVTVDNSTGELHGWIDDPYDYWCRAPLVRNRSERAEFDAEFIDHPLTRTRRTLASIERTLMLASRVRCAPRLRVPTRVVA